MIYVITNVLFAMKIIRGDNGSKQVNELQTTLSSITIYPFAYYLHMDTYIHTPGTAWQGDEIEKFHSLMSVILYPSTYVSCVRSESTYNGIWEYYNIWWYVWNKDKCFHISESLWYEVRKTSITKTNIVHLYEKKTSFIC